MAGPIDEERRAAFERHRLGGGDEPLESFLPPAGDPAHDATLEELVCIDLEIRWRRWRDSGCAGDPPDATPYVAAHPGLGAPDAAARIAGEIRWLRERHGGAAAPAAGAHFGRFTLASRLGRGAFAEVWRAHDPSLHRDVAVKILRPDVAGDPAARERLVREARSAAKLRHPGIVPVHETGEQDGQPYVVSDWIDGPTLAGALTGGPFAPRDAARTAAAVAEAVAYAHRHGIVHRDLKPANVLLADGRTPLVTDFGLACVLGAGTLLTAHGEVIGTPAYMAPEQARGDTGAAGPRSDVYSVGAILYELLCGRPPFEGDTASVLYAVVHRDPEPPGRRADVPADLGTICLTAMAKDPAARYGSADALAEDLRDWLADRPIAARRPGLRHVARLWARRNPVAAGALTFAALAITGIAAAAFLRVVAERDRYLAERDRSQALLRRSLESEAAALIEARDTGWYGRTGDLLRRAAAIPGGDRAALRDLALRRESSHFPSFELAHELTDAEPAVALAESPEAKRIHGVTAGGRVWTRDARTGEVVAASQVSGAPLSLAASADGSVIVVGTRSGAFLAGSAAAGTEAFLSSEEVSAAAFSPSGREFAAGTATGRIEIRSRGEDGAWRESRAFTQRGAVLALAFSPDGATLAAGSADGSVILVEPASGAERRMQVAPDAVRTLAFRPGGAEIVFTTAECLGFETLPLAPGAAPVRRHALHAGAVRRAVPFGDGTLTASADGTLASFGADGARRAVGRGGFASVTGAATDGARRIWSAHSDGALRAWDVVEPPLRSTFQTTHRAAFVPGTSRLLTHRAALDLAAGAPVRTKPFDCVAVTALAADPESGDVWCGRADGSVLRAGPGGAAGSAGSPGDSAVTALAARGGLAACGDAAGIVRIFDRSGRVVRTHSPALGSVHALVFAGDGGALVAVARAGLAYLGADGSVRVADRTARAWGAACAVGEFVAAGGPSGGIEILSVPAMERVALLPGHGTAVCGLAADATSGRLASVAPGEDVRLWDTTRWTETGVLPAFRATTRHLAFESGGGRLLTGGDFGGFVYDARSRQALGVLEVAGVSAVTDSPAGFVVATSQGAVAVLGEPDADPAETGRSPLRASRTVLCGGHLAHVWGVASSPDGRWFATTSHAGEVKLWDARTLRPERDLAVRGEVAWDAAFSADSAHLAVASGKSVLVWDLAAPGSPARLGAGHSSMVTGIAALRGGGFASSSRDGSVRLRTPDGASRALHSGRVPIHGIAACAADGRIAAALADGSVLVWRGPDDAAPARISTGPSPAWAVAFDERGSQLAAATQGGTVLLLDGGTFAVRGRLDSGAASPRSVAFGGHGERWICVGAYQAMSVVWDLHGLRERLDALGAGW